MSTCSIDFDEFSSFFPAKPIDFVDINYIMAMVGISFHINRHHKIKFVRWKTAGILNSHIKTSK